VKTRYVFDQCNSIFNFNISENFYQKQLDKGLTANVYKNRRWGNYRHLPLDDPHASVEHAYVGIAIKNNFSNLVWIWY